MSSPAHRRSRRALDYCLEHPEAKIVDIMEATGVSKNTAIKYRKQAQLESKPEPVGSNDDEAPGSTKKADFDEEFPSKPQPKNDQDEQGDAGDDGNEPARRAKAAFSRRDARLIEHRW